MTTEDDTSFNVPHNGKTSILSTVLGVICFPCTLLCSWYTIREQEEAVLLNYGKFSGIETEPGCHFRNCFGREVRKVSKQKISINLPETKVIDANGNPIIVSAIVLYYFEDSKKCAIDIQDAPTFVYNQAQTVLKTVVSQYPYESEDRKIKCLKRESRDISESLVQSLQEKVVLAGARVISFQFDELSYAPEIAHGMLKRQQALAMVLARTLIVEGAVTIAREAITQLEEYGVGMEPEDQNKLVTNLLTLICSDNDAQTTVNVGGK